MIVLLTISLQLNFLQYVCTGKRCSEISILVSKENCIKKQLFSKQQRKTRKKRQYWFRNCHTDNWWVDIMLAVAPVEDLWKKKMSDSPG